MLFIQACFVQPAALDVLSLARLFSARYFWK